MLSLAMIDFAEYQNTINNIDALEDIKGLMSNMLRELYMIYDIRVDPQVISSSEQLPAFIWTFDGNIVQLSFDENQYEIYATHPLYENVEILTSYDNVSIKQIVTLLIKMMY